MLLAALLGAVAIQPPIVSKPIPFSRARRAETAAYSERHYGVRTWRLRKPRVIVEHVTAGTSFASAWATFSLDRPDAELHELPGTCAHFVIDVGGTIYQLVPLGIICRHTVGLNWTAIGIEHVGPSASAVLANEQQLSASLRLTAWLMQRYGIGIGNVIGHNESLTSPFHRERYAPWRCQTHADWNRQDMTSYRRQLSALARRDGVPLGAPMRRVRSNC
jgi:N-acetylmuramoyl-L-alanine amidase